MSNEIVLDHRETVLNMTADNHGEWEVFTDDPYWIRRLERLSVQSTKKVGEGFKYKLRADQVLIRAGKRQVSEEQRQKSSERMRALKHRMVAANPVSDTELKR